MSLRGIHRSLDCIIGFFLVLLPWISGFSQLVLARDFMVAVGVGLLFYSLATDYGHGRGGAIPMRVHLLIDMIVGTFVMLAPLILGYSNVISSGQVWAHVASGLAVWSSVVFSVPRYIAMPSTRKPIGVRSVPNRRETRPSPKHAA